MSASIFSAGIGSSSANRKHTREWPLVARCKTPPQPLPAMERGSTTQSFSPLSASWRGRGRVLNRSLALPNRGQLRGYQGRARTSTAVAAACGMSFANVYWTLAANGRYRGSTLSDVPFLHHPVRKLAATLLSVYSWPARGECEGHVERARSLPSESSESIGMCLGSQPLPSRKYRTVSDLG